MAPPVTKACTAHNFTTWWRPLLKLYMYIAIGRLYYRYVFYIKPTKVQNDECVFDDPKAI